MVSIGHVCSKPACLGQRNNNGPLKTARNPKTIYSPRNTFTSPGQCTSTAVSETSCIASSCSSQLAVYPVSWHGYNSREILKCIREIRFPLETQLQFSSKAVPTRQCPEIYLLPKNRLPQQCCTSIHQHRTSARGCAGPAVLTAVFWYPSPAMPCSQADGPQQAPGETQLAKQPV